MTSSPTGTRIDRSVDEVVTRFLAGTLPASEWTHRAHLLVARHLLAEASVDEVVAELRRRIVAHNERVGLLPYHGGYHETVTRYFVEAVDATGPDPVSVLLDAPACQRDAPMRHWSPARLRSSEARSGWIEPDLALLPWHEAT